MSADLSAADGLPALDGALDHAIVDGASLTGDVLRLELGLPQWCGQGTTAPRSACLTLTGVRDVERVRAALPTSLRRGRELARIDYAQRCPDARGMVCVEIELVNEAIPIQVECRGVQFFASANG